MASTSSTWKEHEYELGNAFSEIVSSETSSPHKRVPPEMCDVFINHRGIDVKNTIARAIYHTLHCMGLRVFLDVEELQLGDFLPTTIEDAMRSASLHVAIFSNNYAHSPWCLAELSFMLKTGTRIVPVFYHVEPSDLRWVINGKGIYSDAFSNHELKGRYSSERLHEWKMALHTVSYIAGWEINKLNNDEGRLLKSVVNSVIKMMNRVPLEVAKHPVGLDEAVQNFERSTFRQDGSSQIVGIVGLGGCGKTTLAKELYNRYYSSIDRSSFLFDVRDSAAKYGLNKLQKNLLKDLQPGVKGLPFSNINKGKEILAGRLKNLPVLIVLDDVDHVEQIDALLPAKESLGYGSLVIITTRDMGVLAASGIYSIYKMKGLDRPHAQQLFCWHAFFQPYPFQGFEDLAEEFLKSCNGLPLCLKVLGGQLHLKSKEYWKSVLHRVSRVPLQDVKQRLQISYDALEEEEKEAFLDIVCFFIGEKESLAITVWDGSGWSGLHTWEKLLNRCLVEVDEQNRIRIHDHLRDLGREIAARQSPSRLWIPGHKPAERGMSIRGIMAATTVSARCLTYDEFPLCTSHYRPPFEECFRKSRRGFKRLKYSPLGLQLLVLRGNDFDLLKFAELSRNLIWLRWFEFSHRQLPPWFSFKNLRILELHNASALEELWEPEMDPPIELRELIISLGGSFQGFLFPKGPNLQHPSQLTDLIISLRGSFQRFPLSIGRLKHLKKISLIGGPSGQTFPISSLPEEFCHLESLEHLELRCCTKLSSLPAGFGDLTNLNYIDLYFCTGLKSLPLSFKNLSQLRHLDLSLCLQLHLHKDILQNITKLEILKLSFCKELQELPSQITKQMHLRELYLDGTSIKELPADFHLLGKLEVLKIGSPFLTSLPPSLGYLSCLTRFTISHCPKLVSLPESLGQLNCLEYLKLGWTAVEYLPKGFYQLSNLQTMEIINSPIRKLAFAQIMHKLKKITLWATLLSRISISEDQCPNLESLEFVENQYLTEIESLPSSVKFVRLSNCKSLSDIRGIKGVADIQKMETSSSTSEWKDLQQIEI